MVFNADARISYGRDKREYGGERFTERRSESELAIEKESNGDRLNLRRK